MQMLLGLLLLGLISVVGRSYEFHSINWLLENFFDSFILILVILFQEEIRSALIAMANRQTFFNKLNKVDLEDEINEIVEAAWSLKTNKIGSIIVLENMSGLNNIIQTGTVINSTVNRDLITALFIEKGPLHDGAIVIQKNKIAAASCFLPLQSDGAKTSKLGARHRAALGLSNLVDAIVIVTSEETGLASVFFKGEKRQVQDAFTLKRIIKFVWGTGEELDEIMPVAHEGEIR